MIKYSFDLPIYYGKVTVYFDEDLQLIGKELDIGIDKGIEAFTYQIEPHNYVIGIKQNVKLFNLVHEIVHLVNYIYKDHNMILDIENDEHQAYLTGYLFDEIYKFKTQWKIN